MGAFVLFRLDYGVFINTLQKGHYFTDQLNTEIVLANLKFPAP